MTGAGPSGRRGPLCIVAALLPQDSAGRMSHTVNQNQASGRTRSRKGRNVMAEKLALDGGTPVRTKPLPGVGDIHGRSFGDEELANVTEVLKTGRLFRFGGHFVDDYEKAFAALLGVERAVAVTSGTAAVHTALAVLDLEPGDEVIVPPITDMGSVAPILALNLVPVFADVDERTLVLDPESVAAQLTDRTRAILAVHLAGNMCDMNRLRQITEGRGISIIEDCAQAYLSEDAGRLSGTIGDISAFSLQQSKHIASGDGGCVCTSDADLADRAAMFMDKGWDRIKGGREYLMLGLNYRMNELTGAVALAQLGKLHRVVEARREVARCYNEGLRDVGGLTVPHVRQGVRHSWWFYPLLWDVESTGVDIGRFCHALGAEGVPAGAGYIQHPIYDTPFMRQHKTYGNSGYPWGSAGRSIEYRNEDCPAACRAMSKLAVVPVNENFTPEDAEQVVAAIRKVAEAYN